MQEMEGAPSSSSPTPAPPPPSPPPSQPPIEPQPPKESLLQRCKVAWRLLLISNLALAAYMFERARKKDTAVEDRKAAAKVPPASVVTTAPPIPEEPAPSPPITEPPKVREPIPEDQQRELFKWILEEKRKVKPKDREEKRRIDEEKAILKQFIRAKSIPKI